MVGAVKWTAHPIFTSTGEVLAVDMYLHLFGAVGLLMAATVSPQVAAQPGTLITLREEQNGIGGTNVREWVIEKAGKWRLTTYQLDEGKEIPESRKEKIGKLSAERLAEFQKFLEKQSISTLPERFGTPAPVNDRSYTVRYACKEVRIVGVGPASGGSVKSAIQKAAGSQASADAQRLAEVVQAVIETMAKESK